MQPEGQAPFQAEKAVTVTPEMVQQAEWIAGLKLSEADRKSLAGALTGSLRQFEAKWANRSDPLDFSGVWRFRALFPFAADDKITQLLRAET